MAEPFELKDYRSILSMNHPPECTVLIEVGGCQEHEAVLGDGPVDAFVKAVSKALSGRYPSVDGIDITDYHVDVAGEVSDAPVKVTMRIGNGNGTLFTESASGTDIVDASYAAFLSGLRDYLRDAG